MTLRNVPARTVQAMRFPGAPRGLKLACGENPKRVYGARNQMPQTRMGNVALMRADLAARGRISRAPRARRATRRATWRSTLWSRRWTGDMLVHNHCYRADEMAVMLDMAREFGFRIAAFHHAVEAYKIADLLRESGTCAAMWADWWGFKMEAYDAINENIPLVHNAGACAIVHSDDANGIQRLNQEAAKALADGRRMGINITDEVAWRWLAINPATALGIADETGSLRAGKRADVVLWNGNPFSVYTRPAAGLDRRRLALRHERSAAAAGQRFRARPARRGRREMTRVETKRHPGLVSGSMNTVGSAKSAKRRWSWVPTFVGMTMALLAAPLAAQTVAITGGRVVIGDGSEPIDGGTVVDARRARRRGRRQRRGSGRRDDGRRARQMGDAGHRRRLLADRPGRGRRGRRDQRHSGQHLAVQRGDRRRSGDQPARLRDRGQPRRRRHPRSRLAGDRRAASSPARARSSISAAT